MKKGGVAREIKGCRRRCLHHPAPRVQVREARGQRAKERKRERENEEIAEIRETHTAHHGAAAPHIASRARARARAMVCTPHAKLAARGAGYQGPRANHANALRYSPRPWIPATIRNIRPLPIPFASDVFATCRTREIVPARSARRRRVGRGEMGLGVRDLSR